MRRSIDGAITEKEVDNWMKSSKVGRKKKSDVHFLFSVKVFFIFVGKLVNILYCVKKLF